MYSRLHMQLGLLTHGDHTQPWKHTKTENKFHTKGKRSSRGKYSGQRQNILAAPWWRAAVLANTPPMEL